MVSEIKVQKPLQPEVYRAPVTMPKTDAAPQPMPKADVQVDNQRMKQNLEVAVDRMNEQMKQYINNWSFSKKSIGLKSIS